MSCAYVQRHALLRHSDGVHQRYTCVGCLEKSSCMDQFLAPTKVCESLHPSLRNAEAGGDSCRERVGEGIRSVPSLSRAQARSALQMRACVPFDQVLFLVESVRGDEYLRSCNLRHRRSTQVPLAFVRRVLVDRHTNLLSNLASSTCVR